MLRSLAYIASAENQRREPVIQPCTSKSHFDYLSPLITRSALQFATAIEGRIFIRHDRFVKDDSSSNALIGFANNGNCVGSVKVSKQY